jgi:FtsH-binding integral membrane protein
MGPIPVSRERTDVLVNGFVRSVYIWMGVGLAFTGLIIFYVSTSDEMMHLVFENSRIFFDLIIAELALVFYTSGMVEKMTAWKTTLLFVVYSIFYGITLSFIFLVYARDSILSTFFICSATFLACSIYGRTTKKDLTSLSGFFCDGPDRHYHPHSNCPELRGQRYSRRVL